MARFFLLLLVLAIIGAGAVEWANGAWTEPGPPASQGGQTVVLIKPHTPLHAIAVQLQDAHLLNYALAFEFDLRLRQSGNKLKAGEYAIPSKASMAAIATILMSGKSIQYKLTAAEGLTSDMIWKMVQADPVLSGDAGSVPPEGSLLPETYLFMRGTSRIQILDQMHQAQAAFLAAQWAHRADGLPLKNPEQAMILASIVEKETSLPEERRHIASVFINRLRTGMKLETDPTIIYGLTKGYPLGRPIRQSEIEAPTPYNTYAIAGLPPGPICDPGKDSIAAVLNPEQTQDLYFVATGKGGHVFSASYAEHQRNVSAYRAMEKSKEGPVVTVPDLAQSIAPPALPRAVKAAPRRRRHQ